MLSRTLLSRLRPLHALADAVQDAAGRGVGGAHRRVPWLARPRPVHAEVGGARSRVARCAFANTRAAIAGAARALAPRIRDTDAVQQAGFGHLHAPGRRRGGRGRVPASAGRRGRPGAPGGAPGGGRRLLRLAPDHAQGEHDVAAVEGQDVGGLVAPAVPGIEALGLPVGGQARPRRPPELAMAAARAARKATASTPAAPGAATARPAR